jgi:hypothetical protein
MPATPHIEKHLTATEAVRDVVLQSRPFRHESSGDMRNETSGLDRRKRGQLNTKND